MSLHQWPTEREGGDVLEQPGHMECSPLLPTAVGTVEKGLAEKEVGMLSS